MTADEAAARVRNTLTLAYPGGTAAFAALDVLVAAAHDRDRLAEALAKIEDTPGYCEDDYQGVTEMTNIARAALADDGAAG